MRPRRLGPALLVGALLLGALVPLGDAEGQGGGKGRHRGQERGRGSPAQDPADEYALDGARAIEAVNRGEGPQALAFYERTAEQAERDGNHARAARAWHAAMVAAHRLGRFQKAIQDGGRALDMFKAASALTPADLGSWASVHAQLGSSYRAVGDLARSRAILEEGLELSHTRLRGRREDQAEGYLLKGLAMVAYAQQDYATALARSTQAAQFFEGAESRLSARAPERLRTKLRRWAATSFFGVGRAELALGHPDEADRAFDRGLRYARQTGLREVEIEALSGQGSLALARQDWARALAVYQQATTLASQIKRMGGLPALYHGQSRALAGLGRTEEAFVASREAVRHIEEIRADLGDSDLRTGFFEDKQAMYRHAVAMALEAGHADDGFALAEQSRSRTFLDLLGSQTTLSKGRTRALVDEEVRLRSRLADARAEAEDADGSGDVEAARAQADGLEREYRAFLDRVRKESLEQASLMAVEPVTLPEIQRLLPVGTTLLEYQVGEGGAVVWVVERERFRLVRLPGDRASLLAQVRRFRTAITGQAPFADVEQQARVLHRRLIEPARAEIHGDRLVIVPHAILHYLPFAALRSSAGHWLVEDFALGTLPSASVLRYLVDKGAGAPARALVVGNPDLGPALALPWAEREARMVGQREAGATVLVQGEATEAQVKALLGTVGLVHFASHGELREADPLSSAILLVPGGGEDGRLEVREVFGLDLHARLVVLSACETGLGQLSRGDELVGLQRAFLYAGTPAVVTTLWKVDDRASFELIRAFYDHLDPAGPMVALRQAQLETLRAFPHPFAWAAFGLTGVSR